MKVSENINKIYSSEALSNIENSSTPLGSYYKVDRPNLLTKKVASDLNTYRNWREFQLMFPRVWDDNGKLTTVKHPQGYGVKSLFSPVAGVYGHEGIRPAMNVPLLDYPDMRDKIREKTDCSIKALIQASESGEMGRAVYNYSDFMYCKYLGKVPNNYMITLRKFPLPCSDHINNSFPEEAEFNKHLPDMGRLITWLGVSGNEMSNLLSYSYTIPWEDLQAPLDETPHGTAGKEGGGNMGQILSALDGTYGREVANSGGYGFGDNTMMKMFGMEGTMGGGLMNSDLSDSNRTVSSRQNAIMKVKAPGGKSKGLEFEHSIKLTFEYQLRSYDGINGRQAMLDLIGNILIVTYLQGKFFPGSYRGSNMAQSNLFTNLDIFKNKGACNSPANFMNSLWTSVNQVAEGLGFGKGKNTKEALKNLGNNLFEMIANGLINKMGRPQMQAFSSMITPTPTGNWHLTIGNPRNPILSIGNLILTKGTITHTGPLGLDDFPTGLKVEVELEHAKPRDSVAIEQMYMQGNHRIYTPMHDKIEEMYRNASSLSIKITEKDTTQNNMTTSAAQRLLSQPEQATKSAWMKYFGTNDVQAVGITSMEAMVGADKTPPAEDSNKKKK